MSDPNATRPCQAQGCPNLGDPYPDEVERAPEDEPAWFCTAHAQEHGYCYSCGRFFGGVESFDSRESGLCDDCEFEAREDFWEEDEYEAEFEDYPYLDDG